MQLMIDYTFEVNATVAAIRGGRYANINLFYGPMNFPYATNQTDVWVINAGACVFCGAVLCGAVLCCAVR